MDAKEDLLELLIAAKIQKLKIVIFPDVCEQEKLNDTYNL